MPIEVVDFRAETAAEEFAQSLREIGFAVLSHHPIDTDLIDQAYSKWHEFFRSENKHDFAFSAKTHDGYVAPDLSETAKGFSVKDIKEFYHFYPWGRCPENLFSITLELFNAMQAMAQTLLKWSEQHLSQDIRRQLSMPLSKMIEKCPYTMLRILHYPPLTGNEPPNAVRAAAHEDINLLTLLPAATAKGLQVQNNEGEWLDVPCDPDWIIVNSADMLQECTQLFYPATTHRVINPVGEAARQSRLSMPLFLHANDEVVLSERYTAESFRKERFAELGLD